MTEVKIQYITQNHSQLTVAYPELVSGFSKTRKFKCMVRFGASKGVKDKTNPLHMNFHYFKINFQSPIQTCGSIRHQVSPSYAVKRNH